MFKKGESGEWPGDDTFDLPTEIEVITLPIKKSYRTPEYLLQEEESDICVANSVSV